MCLIEGRGKEPCAHEWCRLAADKPQFYTFFKSDYIMNRGDVNEFKLIPEKKYLQFLLKPHVMVVNPYAENTESRNEFEMFRQSMRTHTEAHGYWPSDREIFNKSEVAFVLIEMQKSRPKHIDAKGNTEWTDYLDLTEVAVYIGKGGVPCV